MPLSAMRKQRKGTEKGRTSMAVEQDCLWSESWFFGVFKPSESASDNRRSQFSIGFSKGWSFSWASGDVWEGRAIWHPTETVRGEGVPLTSNLIAEYSHFLKSIFLDGRSTFVFRVLWQLGEMLFFMVNLWLLRGISSNGKTAHFIIKRLEPTWQPVLQIALQSGRLVTSTVTQRNNLYREQLSALLPAESWANSTLWLWTSC